MLALPVLAAVALSISSVAAECTDSFQCHAYCGAMARVARTCGDGTTYNGPFDQECLCGSGSEFIQNQAACLDCGWSLWADYSAFLVAPLAQCGLPTEPTSPNCNLEAAPTTEAAAPTTEAAAPTTEAAAPTTEAAAPTTEAAAAPTTEAAAAPTTEAAAPTTEAAAAPTTAAASSAAAAPTTVAASSAKAPVSSSAAAAPAHNSTISTFEGAAVRYGLSTGLIAAACALLI